MITSAWTLDNLWYLNYPVIDPPTSMIEYYPVLTNYGIPSSGLLPFTIQLSHSNVNSAITEWGFTTDKINFIMVEANGDVVFPHVSGVSPITTLTVTVQSPASWYKYNFTFNAPVSGNIGSVTINIINDTTLGNNTAYTYTGTIPNVSLPTNGSINLVHWAPASSALGFALVHD